MDQNNNIAIVIRLILFMITFVLQSKTFTAFSSSKSSSTVKPFQVMCEIATDVLAADC